MKKNDIFAVSNFQMWGFAPLFYKIANFIYQQKKKGNQTLDQENLWTWVFKWLIN